LRLSCSVLLAASLTIVGLTAGAARADWPTRPVRIIAPSSPGGAADSFARLLADHFSETFRRISTCNMFRTKAPRRP
jgi:tripartite-type tricarboxylate transporter receptor subunit TctC